MKRGLLVFALVMFIIGGGAFAQDLGVTAGLEFGIGQLNHEDADAMDSAWIRPMFMYENTDLVEGLRIYAELGLPLWFSDHAEEFWMGMDLTLSGTFNLELSPEGTLGLMLESASAFWFGGDDAVGPIFREPAPRGALFRHSNEVYDNFATGLGIGVRYTHNLGAMNVFGQVNTAFNLFADGDYTPDALDNLFLDFQLGMSMGLDAGVLGFLVGLDMDLQLGGESPDDTLHTLWFMPSFTFADFPLYVQVEIVVPMYEDGMDIEGMTIIPEFRFMAMDNLQLYFNLPMWNIGADDGDLALGLGLGVLFRF